MQFDIITIFPQILDSYLNESILKRAINNKLINFKTHNLRDWATDKHKTVDDKPYGGGPGMIFKVEPIYKALQAIKKKKKNKIILLSPQGKTFDQKMAKKYSKLDQLIFIAGRYEGFDARVSKLVDEEVSIGNYVLAGGELPALIIAEAVARLLPGVLGKSESLQEESFSEDGYIEYPQYTRPEVFQKMRVPKVLLGGNHGEIKKWREKKGRIKLVSSNL